MLIRMIRVAVVAAASLLVLGTAAPSAQADTRTFRDKGGHLTTVKVSHGRESVTVRAHVGRLSPGDFSTYWFDTDAESRPDYKAVIYPGSDGAGLLRVDNFAQKGAAVACPGFRAEADVFGPQFVTVTVPRACLGNPAKVRVAVRAYYDVKGPDIVDWGPGTKRFFGWVSR